MINKIAADIQREWALGTRDIVGRLWMISSLLLAACSGGAGGDAPENQATTVSSPTTIDLIPATQDGAQRLFLPVIGIGSQQTTLNVLFDTGSDGLTLDATRIFPPSMVSSSGFAFPPGQTSMTYNGITVTNTAFNISFTSATQHGNIGSTQITFGDANGSVTTTTMPVFFYYLITDNQGNPLPAPPQDGIFGVKGTTNEAGGDLASPVKFITFDNLNSGFMLNPVGSYPLCDITQGACPAQPLLTLGLTQSSESAFDMFNLVCDMQTVTGPNGSFSINPGTDGCSSALTATVSIDGVPLNSSPLPEVLFDTGTPGYGLGSILASSAPAVGAVVNVSLPVTNASPLQFSWTVGNGINDSTALHNAVTVIGSNFFLNHAYFEDYTISEIGLQ